MKIKDERIVSASRRILNETYLLVMTFALVSLFSKYYFLKLPMSSYVTELVMIGGSVLYIIVRQLTLGLEIIHSTHQAKLWWSLAAVGLSILATIIAGFQNYQQYHAKYQGVFDKHFLMALVFLFAANLLLTGVIIATLYWLNRRGQASFERRINR
ncbi:DUF6773 family protein [Lapidilactobacillus wuchangensis]|uniref:DUF6773 family protein n=1 Tax=Lapidilactobacillus wuchangensis TaxID=2486001 RepID=UPI000F78723A|nr:DUF6773 family protein [Lapidilactobacillus wuchangensis]